MGFSDTWHRTLVYFGLAEDRDAYEEPEEPDPRDSEAELESRYRERPNVRRLQSRRRRDEIDDIFADDSPSERRTSVLRSVGSGGGTATAPAPEPTERSTDVRRSEGESSAKMSSISSRRRRVLSRRTFGRSR